MQIIILDKNIGDGARAFAPDPEVRAAEDVTLVKVNPMQQVYSGQDVGRLVSIGVNRVMPLNFSTAYAEIVAISMAQKKLGTFDLGGSGFPPMQLVVNCRPCVMCYGAVLWSGIRSLVIASSGPE